MGHGPQCLISGISLHKTEGSFQVELNKLGTDELTVSRNESLEVKKINCPSPGGHLQNLSVWNSVISLKKLYQI